MSLVLAGALAETVGRTTEYAGPLSVVAKNPGVRHADMFGPGGATLARMGLPGGGLELLLDDERRARPWTWTHDPAVAAPFLRLVARADAQPASFACDDSDLVELLAALTARRAEPPAGAPPAWLVRVMQAVRDGDRAAGAVSSLAQAADVHPVYLARCVRRWYGTGIGEEIRRVRLRAAARCVAEGGDTISQIAHAHGFADEPHFNREFRRSAGLPPGRFRRLVRNAAERATLRSAAV